MEIQQRKGWFARNWGWVLGGGCLTLIVLVALFIGSIFFGVSKMFTTSEPYEYAIKQAYENKKVVSILGEPIEKNGMINGNISLKNDSGEADFRIPISGSNENGWIIVVATKSYGKWTYEKLFVQFEGPEDSINLLGKTLDDF